MNQSRLYLGFTICLVALLSVLNAFAQELYGQWSGTVEQSGPGDYQSSYPATMVLNGTTGQMDYPSLGCGGTLTLENQRDTFSFYQESITYGQDECIDGGMVAVEPDGNSVHWAWNVRGVTVSGLLTGQRHLQSCGECTVSRDRCFEGCNREPTLLEQSDCVNRCNEEYSCVTGYDCVD